jgi:hypothetical protein
MTATGRPYALNTHYAGHRFRSRLEARWCVFMDGHALGHAPLWRPWQYEVEGIVLPGRRSYLPDFELGTGFSIEVKGEDARFDIERTELYVKATGKIVLVLGDIPRPGDQGLHLQWACLHAGGGNALWQTWRWFYARDAGVIIPQGHDWPSLRPEQNDVLCPVAGVRRLDMDEQPEVDAAYEAARSARFEFGETPKARNT